MATVGIAVGGDLSAIPKGSQGNLLNSRKG